MTPHYRQSFFAALTGHFVLIIAAVVVSVFPGCRRPNPVDLSAFDKFDIDLSKIDSFNKFERKDPAPEHVATPAPAPPAEKSDPVMPPDPVPTRPVDRTPAPKSPAHDAEGTLPEPKHSIKPAASNAASSTAATPIRIGPRTTKILPGTGPRVPMRPVTPGDLDPLGGMNAPRGSSTSVSMDDRQRCLLLIKHALYDAWDRPTLADAGRQAALLEVRFDPGGRVVSAVVAQSSGSEVMDRSVLQAARTAARVDGLTPAFIKEFPTLPIEFRVTE